VTVSRAAVWHTVRDPGPVAGTRLAGDNLVARRCEHLDRLDGPVALVVQFGVPVDVKP